MILLHGGGLRLVEYKGKTQMGFQQHLKESLDHKLNLKIPLLNC